MVYIERYKFYTQYPRVPRGIYMNVSRPKLEDRNVRLGLQHALNWRKVIDVMFRGDFSRLQGFSQGFGEYTNPAIKARPYSVTRHESTLVRLAIARKVVMGFSENHRVKSSP